MKKVWNINMKYIGGLGSECLSENGNFNNRQDPKNFYSEEDAREELERLESSDEDLNGRLFLSSYEFETEEF